MMEGESDGQKLYNGAEVRELSEIFGKTGILYDRVSGANLSIKNRGMELEFGKINEDFFLHIGATYGIVEAYKEVLEKVKPDVSEAREQFERHEEDLTDIYGVDRVESNKEILFGILDEEYSKFDSSVEEYEKFIDNLDFKKLFENYRSLRNRMKNHFEGRSVTDEEIKQELFRIGILVPVSEGSEELKITKPYENLEELKNYL